MQRNFYKELLFLLIIIGFSVSGFGQSGKTDQNWWMGNTDRGIQFSQPKDSAVLISRSTAEVNSYGSNGGAVASDPITGGLLFYTDGAQIFDASHRRMPTVVALGGDNTRNQSSVISSVPGEPNKYYVFASSAGGISITEVDMTLPGNSIFPAPPLGDVSVTPSPVIGLAGQSEAMIIIPRASDSTYWLITHQAGTDQFNITHIGENNVVGPPVLATPAGALIPPFTASHFAYDSVSNTLAVTPSDVNKNVLLYHFDETNGTLTADANTILFGSSAPAGVPAIFDAEFSPSGQYLYVSRTGTGGNGIILQYNLADRTATPDTVVSGLTASYGLQLGPDSAIYHLYEEASGDFRVGRINDPDTTAARSFYEADVFVHDFNARQFPSFAQVFPSINVDFTTIGTCSNTPIAFFPTVTPGADSLAWNFGDGAGSSAWSPTHTYEEGNTYPVTVYAFVGGQIADSARHDINITQFDTQISLVQDTTACSCELARPKATNGGTVYPNGQACNPFTLTAQINPQDGGTILWYGPDGILSGQNSAEVTIDTAGFYYVTVTQGGCVAYAGVNVKEYGVPDQRANVWHFGNQAGLDFNPQPGDPPGTPSVRPITFPLVSNEGVATISDENGQVILSTNGNDVFDREGTLVATGLGGSQNSSQSALIIPFAGDPMLFYIFVTQEIFPMPGAYELRYAIFDRKAGTYGDVVETSAGPSTVLFSRSTERITGNENWLIAHEFGTNNFIAYPITPQGIGSPVVSSVGSVHAFTPAQEGEGYMELGPGFLGVAVNDRVEIFDFDNATGIVSDPHALPVTGGQAYGIEFSGNKLFVSTLGPPSELHEFVYDSSDQEFQHLGTIISGTVELGAIQTAPNGTIYVAINNSSTLGAIQVNADSTQLSSFDEAAQPLLAGTNSFLGLPNFTQNLSNPPQAPGITFQNPCVGDSVTFQATATDVIDIIEWSFGDTTAIEETVSVHEIKHRYRHAGTYRVIGRIKNRCIGDVATIDTVIVIHPKPVAKKNQVLAICEDVPGQLFAADPPLTGLTFIWSTGETTNEITPPTPRYFSEYSVVVTNEFGCRDTAISLVSNFRPIVELPSDKSVCEDAAAINLDADPNTSNSSDKITYLWTRNGVNAGNSQAVVEPATTPGVFKYVVTAVEPHPRDAARQCVATDSVVITINAAPLIENIDISQPTCGVSPADGSFQFDIGGTIPTLYTFGVTGPNGIVNSQNEVEGPISDIIGGTNLPAGAYTINLQNQISGCSTQATAALSDATFTVEIDRGQLCNDAQGLIPIEISLTTGGPIGSYTYTIRNTTTQQTLIPNATGTGFPQLTAPVPNGTYVAEVFDGTCTAVSSAVGIFQADSIHIEDVVVNECSDQIRIRIDAPTATSFTWSSGAPIDPPGNGPEITSTPGPGTHTYTVRVEGDANTTCPSIQTVTVSPGSPPPTINDYDLCSESVRITITPSTGFDQFWEDASGTPVDNNFSRDENGLYQLILRNQATRCVLDPIPVEVKVFGDLQVNITGQEACEGTPFTLTADVLNHPANILAFQWSFDGTEIPNPQGSNQILQTTGGGEYTVRVSFADGDVCEKFAVRTMPVRPVTPGSLPDEGIICPYEENLDPRTRTVTLNAGDDFLSYEWFTVVGNAETPVSDGNEDGLPQTLVAEATGTYRVRLINFYNCPSQDQITLVEECDPQITGPNAFRPDGLNKEFGLFTFFIAEEDFQIYIFNRWGEMVYQSTARDFKWNGGYKNDLSQPVPPGTYSYVVKYKSAFRPELGVQEFRSGVVVLR